MAGILRELGLETFEFFKKGSVKGTDFLSYCFERLIIDVADILNILLQIGVVMHHIGITPHIEVFNFLLDGIIVAAGFLKLVLNLFEIVLHPAHLAHLFADEAEIARDAFYSLDKLVGVRLHEERLGRAEIVSFGNSCLILLEHLFCGLRHRKHWFVIGGFYFVVYSLNERFRKRADCIDNLEVVELITYILTSMLLIVAFFFQNVDNLTLFVVRQSLRYGFKRSANEVAGILESVSGTRLTAGCVFLTGKLDDDLVASEKSSQCGHDSAKREAGGCAGKLVFKVFARSKRGGSS